MTLLALCAAPVNAAPVLEGDEKGIRLSLEAALKSALENNLDLVSARKDPEIADLGVESAMAFLDPTLSARGDYGKNRSSAREANSPVVPPDTGFREYTTEQPVRSLSASWAHTLDFGGEYQVTASASDRDPSPRTFFFGGLNTGFEDSESQNWAVRVDFSLPLLRGFGREFTTKNILIARSNSEISADTLNLQAQQVLKQVEDAYWDLAAARAALTVANESLRLARDLLDLNKKKVDVGTLAPIEITQAEAGVASREEGFILAEIAVGNTADNLRRLLALPPDDPQWDLPLVPMTEPVFSARAVDVDAAMATALERRAEVVNMRRRLDNSLLEERVARSGTRHVLDLKTAVGVGQSASLSLGEQTTGTGSVPFRQDFDQSPLDWSVGLVYTYPIHNRGAEAASAIATLQREQAETNVRNEEQSVRVDVRTTARGVVSGAKRIEAARSATVLQRKKLEAEQKKFDNGMSTSFAVLTFQNDLQDAQLSEIRALLDYQKALTDLERAQGTLLEARGLAVDVGR